MSEKKYYCFCGNNCKYETMTKEQILSAIAQAVETGVVADPDAGFISRLKETNAGGYITFWVGTRAQYNALGSIEKNCVHIITDDTSAADFERTVEELKAAADELIAANSQRENAGIASLHQYAETMDDLENLIDIVVANMSFGGVRILSVTCGFDGGYGAQVTVHKGGDNNHPASVSVEVLLRSERLYRYAYTRDGILIWKPWEYDNAQMIERETYCTNERYKGKPVYTRMLDFGAMQASGSKSFVVMQDPAEIVGIKVIATKNDGSEAQELPFISDAGQVVAFAKVTDLNDQGMCVVTVTDDMSGYTATCVVKYIKQ